MTVAASRPLFPSLQNPNPWGNKKTVAQAIFLSDTYPNEGETVTPSVLGLNRVDFLFQEFAVLDGTAETAVLAKYDYATQKLLVFECGASGAAFVEKTASEAYPSAAYLDVHALGV